MELGVLTPNFCLLVFMPLFLLIMKIVPEASTEVIATNQFLSLAAQMAVLARKYYTTLL